MNNFIMGYEAGLIIVFGYVVCCLGSSNLSTTKSTATSVNTFNITPEQNLTNDSSLSTTVTSVNLHAVSDSTLDLPDYAIKYMILVIGGLLLVILLVNIVSVIQRRNDQKAIQSYLFTLNTMVPYLSHSNMETTERRASGQRIKIRKGDIYVYEEIEMVPEEETVQENNKSSTETEKRNNSVYSLQRDVDSSQL